MFACVYGFQCGHDPLPAAGMSHVWDDIGAFPKAAHAPMNSSTNARRIPFRTDNAAFDPCYTSLLAIDSHLQKRSEESMEMRSEESVQESREGQVVCVTATFQLPRCHSFPQMALQ
jgi:hypothetical protein